MVTLISLEMFEDFLLLHATTDRIKDLKQGQRIDTLRILIRYLESSHFFDAWKCDFHEFMFWKIMKYLE